MTQSEARVAEKAFFDKLPALEDLPEKDKRRLGTDNLRSAVSDELAQYIQRQCVGRRRCSLTAQDPAPDRGDSKAARDHDSAAR